ncbi:maleylacetate reductase [Pusillimonas sp. (ex Stolz et al. 2005)]|uniref:maleylacetate reductase n=1 Tax=Pusillimonas sp. (ex Stolz et al. 2005) TaxID=1979962 RepID=UPI00260E614B|nr:maleylacetate reductase [Pusillimonas sp. (ex Stolz et al. 2005)]
MKREFIYEALPTRVIFGDGKMAVLPEEIARLGASRALVLSTPPQAIWAQQVAGILGDTCVGVFSEATMHTPVEVTEKAMQYLTDVKADCVVALGGGSTIGLGKAIALRTGLPQIAVPTTYAGSEMTPILGQTENGVKTTLRDAVVLPKTVIYDVSLTLTLPAALSATSGLNAMAHAVEALYAQDRNPIISLMAEEGIAALGQSLPAVVANPQNREARSRAQYGAWLCGICLGSAGMALHHKLCHVLGGTFDLPHAETHAIMLPHTAAYNAPEAPEAMHRAARALKADHVADGLWLLAERVKAPRALKDIGMPESGIDKAVELALKNPYWNPRPLTDKDIRALIRRAWAGEPPQA